MVLQAKRRGLSGRENPQLSSSISNVSKERTQRLNLDIVASKHQALKMLAVRQQTTIKALVTDLIDKLIDESGE